MGAGAVDRPRRGGPPAAAAASTCSSRSPTTDGDDDDNNTYNSHRQQQQQHQMEKETHTLPALLSTTSASWRICHVHGEKVRCELDLQSHETVQHTTPLHTLLPLSSSPLITTPHDVLQGGEVGKEGEGGDDDHGENRRPRNEDCSATVTNPPQHTHRRLPS